MTEKKRPTEPADAPESPEGCTHPGPEVREPVSIFRRAAVERYAYRAEEQALPAFSKPRELLWLWLLVALFAACCLAAGLYLDAATQAPTAGAGAEAVGELGAAVDRGGRRAA